MKCERRGFVALALFVGIEELRGKNWLGIWGCGGGFFFGEGGGVEGVESRLGR